MRDLAALLDSATGSKKKARKRPVSTINLRKMPQGVLYFLCAYYLGLCCAVPLVL